MDITKEWLKNKSACKDGYEWALKTLNNKPMAADEFINALIKDEKYQWASWVLVRVFDKPNNVRYAIFAAEQVIKIYEKKYPDNDKPRNAIDAAKKWLDEPNEKNRADADAAYAAADAAAADAAAADAAYAAAYAAAAYAAADAADAAAADAAAAAYAAADAAAYADDAYAAAARKQMRIKILTYAVSLL
jgi:hypothetical protein